MSSWFRKRFAGRACMSLVSHLVPDEPVSVPQQLPGRPGSGALLLESQFVAHAAAARRTSRSPVVPSGAPVGGLLARRCASSSSGHAMARARSLRCPVRVQVGQQLDVVSGASSFSKAAHSRSSSGRVVELGRLPNACAIEVLSGPYVASRKFASALSARLRDQIAPVPRAAHSSIFRIPGEVGTFRTRRRGTLCVVSGGRRPSRAEDHTRHRRNAMERHRSPSTALTHGDRRAPPARAGGAEAPQSGGLVASRLIPYLGEYDEREAAQRALWGLMPDTPLCQERIAPKGALCMSRRCSRCLARDNARALERRQYLEWGAQWSCRSRTSSRPLAPGSGGARRSESLALGPAGDSCRRWLGARNKPDASPAGWNDLAGLHDRRRHVAQMAAFDGSTLAASRQRVCRV